MTNQPRTTHERVRRALALQPFVCAALGLVLFPVIDRAGQGRTVDALQTALVFATFTGIVGALITAFVAYPVFVRLAKPDVLTGARVLLFGALLGNIPAVIAILVQVLVPGGKGMTDSIAAHSGAAVFGTFLGTVCSAIFWTIVRNEIASNRSTSGEEVHSDHRDSPR